MNNVQLTTCCEVGTKYDCENDYYPDFLKSIKNNFRLMVGSGIPLFTTYPEKKLFDAFLNNLPDEARQHYRCDACRHFVNNYGGLVTISFDGKIESVLWNGEVPEFFSKSVKAMRDIVLKSRVRGVFLSELMTLGHPVTGEWHHMSVNLPSEIVYQPRLKTANQMIAEKREDFRILSSGISEYPVKIIDQALTLLRTESLVRFEKCLGVAEWLKDLYTRCSNTKNTYNQDNILWLAVATAPSGYCHIKSSMIGTLLDDIVDGLSFESISRRFADKMDSLQYQRPQVAPTEGNVIQAEKIIEKLGNQKSFIRRFARLDELEKIWVPKEKKEQIKNTGVFSHLITKNINEQLPKMDIPGITMTWEKFLKTVIPFAEKIEYFVKHGLHNFSSILTASHEDAPPIIQWDNEEKRNPFSWYIYRGGSPYSMWGLSLGYCKVSAICFQPSMWYSESLHHGKGIMFILEGAKDTNYKNIGNCLFPEILKSELREIRSTIEAYSKDTNIEGYEESSASGIILEYDTKWDTMFRVTTNTGEVLVYKLDRWD